MGKLVFGVILTDKLTVLPYLFVRRHLLLMAFLLFLFVHLEEGHKATLPVCLPGTIVPALLRGILPSK